MLFDHLGDDEEMIFRAGRISRDDIGAGVIGDDIRAQWQAHRNDGRHRFDAIDIDSVELFDKGEHRVQLLLNMGRFIIAQRDAREMRNAADGSQIDGHESSGWTGGLKSSTPYSTAAFGEANGGRLFVNSGPERPRRAFKQPDPIRKGRAHGGDG
jgi:hypothetical protein